MNIIKYTFNVPVVVMVSHIPAKSHMAVKYVIRSLQSHKSAAANTSLFLHFIRRFY